MAFIIGFAIFAAAAAATLTALQQLATKTSRHRHSQAALIDLVNNELPQLQCGECTYAACRPYAQAIVEDGAPIHLCPPGGAATVARLAQLLNIEDAQQPAARPPQVATIRMEDCVGCALCLPVCPTDAIIGTAKYAHHVLTADCVGCGLCVTPCPVDCIDLIPLCPA